MFADRGLEFLAAQSFAKNMGLYGMFSLIFLFFLQIFCNKD